MVAGTVPGFRDATARRSLLRTLRRVDFLMVSVVVAIAGLGVLMVYSATRTPLAEAGADPAFIMKRQVLFVAAGLVAMTAAAVPDYRELRRLAGLGYAVALVLLVAVLSPLGSESKGAQAWFQMAGFQLQPSELAKPLLILTLAAYLARFRGEVGRRFLVVTLALAAGPVVLIMLQPDLGTALVFGCIVLGMVLVAGARVRHLILLLVIGVAGVVGVLRVGVLEDYQQERLTAFLDQEGDSQRTSYNLEQSRIAIGAGGLTGRGLFEGTQTNLSYVPEQHTDFIFTAVGEQLGFAGAATLLSLFGVLGWRVFRAAQFARDLLGTLICAGVLSMLVFQIFQNVGMTLGLMPITGIPLPLVSHGGSATVATLAALGLVLNVRYRAEG